MTCFNQWVNDNNVDPKHPYSKGWWDWITLIQKWESLLRAEDVTVVATYELSTPPPVSILVMPIVRFEIGSVSIIIKHSFDALPVPEYCLWVIFNEGDRGSGIRFEPFVVDDYHYPQLDRRHYERLINHGVENLTLPDNAILPTTSVRNDSNSYRMVVQTEWDAYAILRIIAHDQDIAHGNMFIFEE